MNSKKDNQNHTGGDQNEQEKNKRWIVIEVLANTGVLIGVIALVCLLIFCFAAGKLSELQTEHSLNYGKNSATAAETLDDTPGAENDTADQISNTAPDDNPQPNDGNNPVKITAGQEAESEPEATPTPSPEPTPDPEPTGPELSEILPEPKTYDEMAAEVSKLTEQLAQDAPKTTQEMITLLRYVNLNAPDDQSLTQYAWWTDLDGNIVQTLEPEKQYRALFFLFVYNNYRDVLSGATLSLMYDWSRLRGGCYAFPEGAQRYFCAHVSYDGGYGEDFWLAPISATDKALELTFDEESFSLYQAYGPRRWTFGKALIGTMVDGAWARIGTDACDGNLQVGRANALVFTFEVTTSEGIDAPILLIRDDKTIMAYDYTSDDEQTRWTKVGWAHS